MRFALSSLVLCFLSGLSVAELDDTKARNSIDNAPFPDGPTYGYGSGYGGIQDPSWSARDHSDTNSTVPSPYHLAAGYYSWGAYQAFPGSRYPSSEFPMNFSDPSEFNSTEYIQFTGESSYSYGLGYGDPKEFNSTEYTHYTGKSNYGYGLGYGVNFSGAEVFNSTQYNSYPDVPSYGYGLGYGGNFSEPTDYNSTEYPSYPERPSYGYGYGQGGYAGFPEYTGFPFFATVSSSHPVHFLNTNEPNSTEATPFSEGPSDEKGLGDEGKSDEEDVKEETIEKPEESD